MLLVGVAVLFGMAPVGRLDSDFLLDRGLLHRFRRGKLRIPYRQRDFSSGDPRNGYRIVLCARHAVRRRHGRSCSAS